MSKKNQRKVITRAAPSTSGRAQNQSLISELVSNEQRHDWTVGLKE